MYIIQSKIFFKSKKTGELVHHLSYLHSISKLGFPIFGNKEEAKTFATKKLAMDSLKKIGHDKERYLIIPYENN